MRGAAVFAICCAAPVFAGDSAEGVLLSLEGDVEYGAYLAGECTGCHKSSGASKGIPSITGLEPEAFRLSMLDYKDGARDHQVMNMIAGRLSGEEIAALSAFFATLEASERK